MVTDIILNSKYIGTCEDPKKFIENFRALRRSGKISNSHNIGYNETTNTIYIENEPGRLRRPLIVVENGVSKLTEDILTKLKNEEIDFSYLVDNGIVEFLDAMEENLAYVALSEKDLTVEHTHLEISPIVIYGLNTSTVPFSNYDEAARLMRGQKTIKQGLGIYSFNYLIRKETDRNLLVYPEVPLVKTFTYDLLDLDIHASGENLIIALMSFEGYHIEDAIILNQSSIERGLQRSYYFKLFQTSEIKYPGGLQDRITVPNKDVKGYRLESDYRYLENDGIIYPGQYVESGDVIIGKVSPPRFIEDIEGFGQMVNFNVDSSIALKEEESGVVSAVFVIENEAGNKEVNVLLREFRNPIIGDKFASRHGQKGVVGAVFKQADMPFTENGIVPDIIFSPHSVPSRKTVSHVMEILAGKVAALSGRFVDSTPFEGENIEDLRDELEKLGFNRNGTEVMYDPKTGKKMKAEIYVGSLYYLRLTHQVDNKIQARGEGPVQLLTRQPAEGRVRGGGLKLGEMEKDALISHGAALLLKERFSSDMTTSMVCRNCGYVYDPFIKDYKHKCPMCGSTKFDKIEISYAFRLFLNELRSMGVNINFKTISKFLESERELEKILRKKKEMEGKSKD